MNKAIRILMIEDDPDYVDIVRMCLSEPDSMEMRFELESADRLAAGLSLLDTSSYDAVLLDLMLPDSRGLDTFLQVLSRGYETPILVATSSGDEATALEAMRLGAQDYMVKATSDSRMLKRSIWYAIERRKVLAQSENIIKRAADGMVVIDESGVIQYANPAAERIFGLSSEQMLGQPYAYPVIPGETSLLKIAGREWDDRTAEMRVTEIHWKGNPARLASIRDITELQRIEQLKAEIRERRKLDALKDDFIGTVSHELRTPLTIVKGAIDNLREGVSGALEPKQADIIALAHRNLTRLTRMITNLLDLSRLEAGGAKANRRRLNAAEPVREAIENFQLLAEEQNIALSVELPPSLPDVYADGDMIMQILGNLIDNGLRYAQSKLVVKASHVQDSPQLKLGPGVLFEVGDDGRGIPPDKVGDLFNKFVQVDRKHGGEGYKGTGLGLAICKEIATLHGGRIWAESAPGATWFRFFLPLNAEKTPAPVASATPEGGG